MMELLYRPPVRTPSWSSGLNGRRTIVNSARICQASGSLQNRFGHPEQPSFGATAESTIPDTCDQCKVQATNI